VPAWITSTETNIKIEWEAPTDDGGCPVIEYQIYRDDGQGGSVNTLIHYEELKGIYYARSLTVTDLPVSSVGKRFRFKVRVVTNFATVDSAVSESMILADRPDKPSMAPTRNTLTSNTTLAANILAVPGDHGSAIFSYHIEVDDGLGGPFIEL